VGAVAVTVEMNGMGWTVAALAVPATAPEMTAVETMTAAIVENFMG
jgi:hypothetical protein